MNLGFLFDDVPLCLFLSHFYYGLRVIGCSTAVALKGLEANTLAMPLSLERLTLLAFLYEAIAGLVNAANLG
jgi:hypothetical protein